MKRNRLLIPLLVALLAAFIAPARAAEKPNIIVILTDDMDLTLLPYMENVNKLIAQEGVTLRNYFVTSPLCCPSRASMLRATESTM